MGRLKYSQSGLLLTSVTMASMRETAFGTRAYFATKEIMEHAERLRDDDAMLVAAKAKRQRKLARNQKVQS